MTPPDQVRRVLDSGALAALSHPLRRQLLDVLRVHGPGSVSMLAERTGQRVGNVSFHVRVLARSGFVDEAPELARNRRERWWRTTSMAVRWSSTDFAHEPAAAEIVQATQAINLSRHVELIRAWYDADTARKERWQEAAFSTDRWLHLTPSELAELSADLNELLNRWSRRAEADADADAEGREPVMVLGYGFPAQP